MYTIPLLYIHIYTQIHAHWQTYVTHEQVEIREQGNGRILRHQKCEWVVFSSPSY